MINTQRELNQPVEDEQKLPDLTQPLLTHFSNPEDSGYYAVTNTRAFHHHINDQNLLINHLTAQQLSPSLITFAYLTAVDKINFFSACKKSYYHPYSTLDHYEELNQQIDAFMRRLKIEFKSTVYRHCHTPFSHYSYKNILSLMLFFSLMIGSIIFSSVFISSRLQACYAVIDQMAAVINLADPANHCDQLVGNYGCTAKYFEKNPYSNCAALCYQLTTLSEYLTSVAFVGLVIPGAFVLLPLLMISYEYASACVTLCIGTSRFDKLLLSHFSAQLIHSAEQLFSALYKYPALASPALARDSSVQTIRRELTKIQKKTSHSSNPMRFFKESAMTNTSIEIIDEAPSPSPG